MAAAEPVKAIKAEVTCSICSDLFRDPVTTECGHSFCEPCIAQHCEGREFDVACPLCKRTFCRENLRPNRELRNIVDSINQSSALQGEEEPGGDAKCENHQEPLKLYCKNDHSTICVICKQSRAHRGHTVVPVEEAVKKYRKTLRKHLETIESNCEKLLLFMDKDWKHIPQSAREEEVKRLKGLTEKLAKSVKVEPESHGRRFEERASQTEAPGSEWKRSSPGRELAGGTELQGQEGREPGSEPAAGKQEEMRSHVGHVCEEAPTPKYGLDQATLDPTIHMISNTTESPEHKADAPSRGDSLQDLTSAGAALGPGGSRQDGVSPGGGVALSPELQGCAVEVTLDPATAHPRLVLSKDRKSVRHGDAKQRLPNNSERFDISTSVLGSEGFTSGRRYWEVEVGPRGGWAIGVARDSVQRKGNITLKPHVGIWALDFSEKFQVLRKVGVYLDYEGGEVRFYNAENKALISSLTATFTGRLVPFFRLQSVGSHISLSPCQR